MVVNWCSCNTRKIPIAYIMNRVSKLHAFQLSRSFAATSLLCRSQSRSSGTKRRNESWDLLNLIDWTKSEVRESRGAQIWFRQYIGWLKQHSVEFPETLNSFLCSFLLEKYCVLSWETSWIVNMNIITHFSFGAFTLCGQSRYFHSRCCCCYLAIRLQNYTVVITGLGVSDDTGADTV